MVDRQPVALDALLVGNLSPIDDRGTQSGIDKHPIYGSVQLGSTGFTGDHQGISRGTVASTRPSITTPGIIIAPGQTRSALCHC